MTATAIRSPELERLEWLLDDRKDLAPVFLPVDLRVASLIEQIDRLRSALKLTHDLKNLKEALDSIDEAAEKAGAAKWAADEARSAVERFISGPEGMMR